MICLLSCSNETAIEETIVKIKTQNKTMLNCISIQEFSALLDGVRAQAFFPTIKEQYPL